MLPLKQTSQAQSMNCAKILTPNNFTTASHRRGVLPLCKRSNSCCQCLQRVYIYTQLSNLEMLARQSIRIRISHACKNPPLTNSTHCTLSHDDAIHQENRHVSKTFPTQAHPSHASTYRRQNSMGCSFK